MLAEVTAGDDGASDLGSGNVEAFIAMFHRFAETTPCRYISEQDHAPAVSSASSMICIGFGFVWVLRCAAAAAKAYRPAKSRWMSLTAVSVARLAMAKAAAERRSQ
jgi:hypothetical protein